MNWSIRSRELHLDRPLVMGIVNVTPDSFSDGGRFFSPESAIAHGARLVAEGADLLDVGGESTRPQGAVPVSAAAERERVLPVIAGLRERFPALPLSVDTVKAEVAAAAVEAGADIVNDVSAFRLDAAMPEVCARTGVGVVLMHSRGGVSDMATFAFAKYDDDVVGQVIAELEASLVVAREAGIGERAICLDPGIGFAKRGEHSLAVLAGLDRIVALGYPVLVGVSRKRVIGELSGVEEPAERVDGTIAANVLALAAGARIFRVHDVAPARRALDTAWGILQARQWTSA